MTTAQHSDTAMAVARDTGWNLDETAADHEWSAVGTGPVGRHRDSGALDRSNFDVILADLRERFGVDAIDVASFGHWGVGWVEELIWDVGRADIAECVREWRDALADYPVADEMHFSALEYEEAIETIKAVASSWATIDDVEYETLEPLPDDWAEQVFSSMFDAGADTSPDGMRGQSIDDAMLELGFYVRA